MAGTSPPETVQCSWSATKLKSLFFWITGPYRLGHNPLVQWSCCQNVYANIVPFNSMHLFLFVKIMQARFYEFILLIHPL